MVREIPTVLLKDKTRISLAIKSILIASNKNSNKFYKNFKQEIILNAQNNSETIKNTNDLQRQVSFKKRYFYRFKWRKA